jgi:uncharacterized protein YjbI with pentapeptide repeats
MKRVLFAALAALLLMTGINDAHADCTEPAGPDVNWRRCYLDSRDLNGVNLEGAMLRDATFQRARLGDANLAKVDAYRAKFVSARMQGVRLDGARLIEADLTRADLTGASLVEADLRNAKFINADLRQANLTGARLSGTDFRNAELTGATWVDGKRVCGENSIGQCN